ncbi:MAG: bifunctional diaminohydroxyphosphoribosylaminopyrimidine deaminase/5-amino-6-(5-phosphoribosylamino)uracil reductase RibD, partial [Chitinophagaceae bacterium]|nr:bifunctional diaminohydroxyphosphoribosylaminopyrimidine deaminase/5-amino-6-(5-phosphoribosylamino)uracil reductase RibD [Chitinophagaceae bacterium]
AEVIAINNALANGADLSTCTLYVTLEPCSHTGKTPPCTDLIIQHRIPRVVIGSMDPNPLVSGASILREKGIAVEVHSLPEIVEMNDTFNINQQLKRPKYILKSAITLNGKIADSAGNSKWISNEQSRDHVHEYIRAKADAILTTAKTVIRDNATMNIRIKDQKEEELNLIVFDRNLDLLKKENHQLSIFYKRTKSVIYLITENPEITTELPNVEIIHIPMNNGMFNLEMLHKELLGRNICQVLIEAGGSMNSTMMEAKSVDEIYTFICPRILMDFAAINQFNSSHNQTMENAVKLQLLHSMTIGEDILLRHKVIH